MTEQISRKDLLRMAADVVAAQVSNNTTSVSDLPNLIHQVYHALSTAGTDAAGAPLSRPKPAVPIAKSVTDDYIICLEDGKKLKMLRRHLRSVYNMSPEEYRERWGLPADYPTVAPNYALHRSRIAKESGLGSNGRRGKLKIVHQEGSSPVSATGG